MSVSLQPIPQTSDPRVLGRIGRDSRFDYSIVITFVTGTDNFTPNIPIQQDAHFLCVETTYANSLVVCAGGSTVPVFAFGGALVQLTDGRTQKPLQNTRVPVDSIFGHGREPFVWPIPHIFAANSPLGIDITGSVAGMAGGAIRLTFSGYKVPITAVSF